MLRTRLLHQQPELLGAVKAAGTRSAWGGMASDAGAPDAKLLHATPETLASVQTAS